MEELKLKFGIRIRNLRVEKKYSQEKLAELAELDRTYIPGIENGKRNVSLEVIGKLARALDINISVLFENL